MRARRGGGAGRSRPLAALAGLRLDLRPTIRHKLVIPDVPAVPPDASDDDSRRDGRTLAARLAGRYALWTDAARPRARPWRTSDERTTSPWAARPAIATQPGSAEPALGSGVGQAGPDWFLQAGQYTYTPDHRPLLGPTEVDGPGAELRLQRPRHHGERRLAAAWWWTRSPERVPTAENPFRPQREMRSARSTSSKEIERTFGIKLGSGEPRACGVLRDPVGQPATRPRSLLRSCLAAHSLPGRPPARGASRRRRAAPPPEVSRTPSPPSADNGFRNFPHAKRPF